MPWKIFEKPVLKNNVIVKYRWRIWATRPQPMLVLQELNQAWCLPQPFHKAWVKVVLRCEISDNLSFYLIPFSHWIRNKEILGYYLTQVGFRRISSLKRDLFSLSTCSPVHKEMWHLLDMHKNFGCLFDPDLLVPAFPQISLHTTT